MIDTVLLGFVAFMVSVVYTACVAIAVLRCCGKAIDDVSARVDALETKEIEGG